MAEPTADQQQSTTASDPPKRDKFSSMAAAAQQQEPATEPAPPKRDKFASMAAASSQQQHSISTPTTANTKVENTQALLKQRMVQRNQVLKDLQQAEGWTWQLLALASKTARSLSTLDMSNATKEDISNTSKQYRETLQEIHSTLSTQTSLVVAYENHDVDKNQNVVEGKEQEEKEQEEKKDDTKKREGVNMYAARVEMRLAQERRDVLKELLRLEQHRGATGDVSAEGSMPATAGDKRKRQH